MAYIVKVIYEEKTEVAAFWSGSFERESNYLLEKNPEVIRFEKIAANPDIETLKAIDAQSNIIYDLPKEYRKDIIEERKRYEEEVIRIND